MENKRKSLSWESNASFKVSQSFGGHQLISLVLLGVRAQTGPLFVRLPADLARERMHASVDSLMLTQVERLGEAFVAKPTHERTLSRVHYLVPL